MQLSNATIECSDNVNITANVRIVIISVIKKSFCFFIGKMALMHRQFQIISMYLSLIL
jgi:hypothetical protein